MPITPNQKHKQKQRLSTHTNKEAIKIPYLTLTYKYQDDIAAQNIEDILLDRDAKRLEDIIDFTDWVDWEVDEESE